MFGTKVTTRISTRHQITSSNPNRIKVQLLGVRVVKGGVKLGHCGGAKVGQLMGRMC
jgi:hypothetical protein